MKKALCEESYVMLDVDFGSEATLGPRTPRGRVVRIKMFKRLTMLSMFVEANAMGLVHEENDQVKLKYRTFTMTTSRSSGKST